MRRTAIFVICAVSAVLAAAPAASAGPNAYASAQKQHLAVTSGVEVRTREVAMKGGWNNENLSCDQWRRLRVEVEINYFGPGEPKLVRKFKVGVKKNCGRIPNFGYELSATGSGLACPAGTWRPGEYSFATRTLHVASETRSIATLQWENTASC